MDNHLGHEERVVDRGPRVATSVHSNLKCTTHHLCNELIEIDGDVATSESYFLCNNRLEHEGREYDWFFAGRYVDRFERAGVWAIAHRTVVFDWERIDELDEPPTDFWPVGFLARAHRGAPSTADYSYQRLSGL